MIGPVIGSFLYASLKYTLTFISFTAILIINVIGISFALPSSLNKSLIMVEEVPA